MAEVMATEATFVIYFETAVASLSAAKDFGELQEVSLAGAHRCDLASIATRACLSNLGQFGTLRNRIGRVDRRSK
ncbi:unnamed protein product [marine sediment metagenome]|uniref:Uncharacterized protein n=1 Tax=marine sediment metagenome TaxID=412755 RepID=X1BIJ0_9ZZZZ